MSFNHAQDQPDPFYMSSFRGVATAVDLVTRGRSDFSTAAAVHNEWVELNPAAPAHQIRPWHELDISDQRKDIHFASTVRAWLLDDLELVPEGLSFLCIAAFCGVSR